MVISKNLYNLFQKLCLKLKKKFSGYIEFERFRFWRSRSRCGNDDLVTNRKIGETAEIHVEVDKITRLQVLKGFQFF